MYSKLLNPYNGIEREIVRETIHVFVPTPESNPYNGIESRASTKA
jgi:hypothetical protein